jgi:hypothetical protein
MANELTNTEHPSYITDFMEAFNNAKEGIVRAAHIYFMAINENPERAMEFRVAIPDISESAWRMLEDIGADRMDSRLILSDRVPHKSKIARLPYQVQKRVLDGEQFDLLVDEGDVLKVDAKQVTSDQANQLFDRDNIRTVPQQKLWLMDRARKAKLTKGEPEETWPYLIRGDRITFKRNVTLTKSELRTLLQSM